MKTKFKIFLKIKLKLINYKIFKIKLYIYI